MKKSQFLIGRLKTSFSEVELNFPGESQFLIGRLKTSPPTLWFWDGSSVAIPYR